MKFEVTYKVVKRVMIHADSTTQASKIANEMVERERGIMLSVIKQEVISAIHRTVDPV